MYKVYKKHWCKKSHVQYNTMARCIWRKSRPVWVVGEGQWATLAWCRDLSVELHDTKEKAETVLSALSSHGCGGACHNDHEIVKLELPSA